MAATANKAAAHPAATWRLLVQNISKAADNAGFQDIDSPFSFFTTIYSVTIEILSIPTVYRHPPKLKRGFRKNRVKQLTIFTRTLPK
jgi:hypothetical protein